MTNKTATTKKSYAPIVIVAGIGKENRAIGMKNELLWHVPDDLKRFKQLTTGHPVIMGRKTFESILKILGKPLPGRTNIIVTRDDTYSQEDVRIVHSLDDALDVAQSESPTEIHIGGGSELYRQALPFVSRLHITWFFDEKPGDTFFPDFEDEFMTVSEQPIREYNDIKYQWVDYIRQKKKPAG